MNFKFFSKAKNIEQAKRHLNTVFLSIIDEINYSDSNFSNQLFKVRGLGDYKKTFNFIQKQERFLDFEPYMVYLKERLEISDSLYEKIVGIEELSENYRTPGGYSQEQDFILIFHLVFLFLLNHNSGKPFIDSVFKIAYGLNYSAEHTEFVYNSIGKKINTIETYYDLPSIEEIVKKEFTNRFSQFPPLSHG